MPPDPVSLDGAQLAEVETLAAVLTAEQVADYFGIGRRTFYRLMDRDPEVAARYKRGKARAVGAIAQGLIQKARAGNVTAMIFFLKTQGSWRETTAIAHLGPDEVDAHPGGSRQKLAELVERLARHQRQAGEAGGIVTLPHSATDPLGEAIPVAAHDAARP